MFPSKSKKSGYFGLFRSLGATCRTQSGWSMVELIVVVGISGLLGLVTIPKLVSSTSELSLKRSSRELVHLLNTASTYALRSNCALQVQFRTGGSEILLSSLEDSCPEPRLRPRSHKLPKGLKIAAASFGNIETAQGNLIVRADGTTTPGRITIESSSGKACTITQALRGARRVSC